MATTDNDTVMETVVLNADGVWDVDIDVNPQTIVGSEDFVFLGQVQHLPPLTLKLRSGATVTGYALSAGVAFIAPEPPKPYEVK